MHSLNHHLLQALATCDSDPTEFSVLKRNAFVNLSEYSTCC